MGFCAEKDVAISFLSENGRFLARVQGPMPGNVLLRREHYRQADNPEACDAIAGAVIAAKLLNSRSVLRRTIRDHGGRIKLRAVEKAANHMAALVKELPSGGGVDSLRGLEGEAARAYFGVFDHLVINQKADFEFKGRNRRPPLDKINCLLSFIYTLLLHDVRSALESVGFDSAVGFLHRDRPGRPGLALDMMEEFRPILADRLVLSLINQGSVRKKGFKKSQAGAVLMDDDTRKKVLVAYQKRKQTEIVHPFLGEKMTIGNLFHIQALLLSRYLRGDLDGYPAFVWR